MTRCKCRECVECILGVVASQGAIVKPHQIEGILKGVQLKISPDYDKDLFVIIAYVRLPDGRKYARRAQVSGKLYRGGNFEDFLKVAREELLRLIEEDLRSFAAGEIPRGFRK